MTCTLPAGQGAVHATDLVVDRYLVTPKMDCDLHKVLESNILQSQHIQFFLYQILRAIKVRP